MKRKNVYVLLALCMMFLASCRIADDDTVTGDVKEQSELQTPDVFETHENEAETDAEIPKTGEEKETSVEDVQDKESIETVLADIDAVLTQGGEYQADAVKFCEAVISKDAQTFAEFTGGVGEYYDFLGKAEIASYTLIPFEISPEVLESHIYHGNYPVASDNYFVEFDVISSDCEQFNVGKCIYYAGFEMNPLSGNLLSVFVPIDKTYRNILDRSVISEKEAFAKEFASLYPVQSTLYEGRNYADSFDFSNHAHLITHLMAGYTNYGMPPYTPEEINEFISESFDGNKGLTLAEMNSGGWTLALYDENHDEERIYGCSYAHGGTSVVSDIVNTETDGDRTVLTLDIYADVSKVAKAYNLVFHFTEKENGSFCLTMVEKRDDTGRAAMLLSV